MLVEVTDTKHGRIEKEEHTLNHRSSTTVLN
jgi:hypothetical protein